MSLLLWQFCISWIWKENTSFCMCVNAWSVCVSTVALSFVEGMFVYVCVCPPLHWHLSKAWVCMCMCVSVSVLCHVVICRRHVCVYVCVSSASLSFIEGMYVYVCIRVCLPSHCHLQKACVCVWVWVCVCVSSVALLPLQYSTEVEGKALLLSLDCSTYPWSAPYNAMLSKEASSNNFESFVWFKLRLNPGLPNH